MFEIYNKSSEDMKEIESKSIDLIMTSPPYNMGPDYKTFNGDSFFEEYLELLNKVIKECFRVQTGKGKLIVEIADSIRIKDKYIQLAGLFQSICIKVGYKLINRHINFINTKGNIEVPDHSFDDNYSTKLNGHSNCHQIIIFSKDKNSKVEQGKVIYSTYLTEPDHPCPFPKTHFFILDKYFEKGMSVLDPFMGTANLGVEVLRRGSKFYGYDIVKKYYGFAKKKLERINN